MWKFATLLMNSPAMGSGMITLANDARVTHFGKWLRKTKINELPQIINVLLGDMSIVGPRPFVDEMFSAYSTYMQAIIYNVKPGLTGIGSIVFRDEEKIISNSGLSPIEFYRQHIAPYKGQLELWYHDHISLFTDLLIILFTVWQIVFSKSESVYRIFKDLPQKPESLQSFEREEN